MTVAPNKNLYFPRLDGLRFMAFLLVFLHHYTALYEYKPLQMVGSRGWMGVELFFVLSSFLLTKLLVEEIKKNNTVAVKKFFFRRILRIWPLYFFYIITTTCVFFPEKFTSLETWRLLGAATFTDNIFTAIFNYNFSFSFVSHLWTISLEEQYYIFLPFVIPFLMKLSRKKLGIIMGSVFLVFVGLRLACTLLGVKHPVIWVLPFQCDAFIFGTLYGLGFFEPFFNKINPFIRIFIGLLLIGITFYFPNIDVPGYSQVFSYTLIGAGFVFLVDGVMTSKTRLFDLIFGNAVLRYLGKITFGLYMYHIIAIQFGTQIFEKLHLTKYPGSPLSWRLRALVILLLIFAVSALSYALLEKPFLKWKKRFTEVESRPV